MTWDHNADDRRNQEGTTLPETLQIRLTADDKARWSKAAKAAEQSLSEWIRDCLDKAAGKAQRGDSGERGNDPDGA